MSGRNDSDGGTDRVDAATVRAAGSDWSALRTEGTAGVRLTTTLPNSDFSVTQHPSPAPRARAGTAANYDRYTVASDFSSGPRSTLTSRQPPARDLGHQPHPGAVSL